MASNFRERFKKVSLMKRVRNFLAMMFVFAICASMTTPVFAAESDSGFSDQLVIIGGTGGDEGGVMPLLSQEDYTIGKPSERYVRVVNEPGGINRVVHIEVLGFNSILYQVDAQVFDGQGLLWSEDNCTKASNSVAIECGPTAVAVWVRIKPRAALVTGDKAFMVRVTY